MNLRKTDGTKLVLLPNADGTRHEWFTYQGVIVKTQEQHEIDSGDPAMTVLYINPVNTGLGGKTPNEAWGMAWKEWGSELQWC